IYPTTLTEYTCARDEAIPAALSTAARSSVFVLIMFTMFYSVCDANFSEPPFCVNVFLNKISAFFVAPFRISAKCRGAVQIPGDFASFLRIDCLRLTPNSRISHFRLAPPDEVRRGAAVGRLRSPSDPQRDSSRNVSTAQTRLQNSEGSLAHQHRYGL